MTDSDDNASPQALIIYHGNCPDGFTAAWVTERALDGGELFSGSYGEPPPLELACQRDVYVVDFSYPRTQLLELAAVARSLLVLDHHKTAEAELAGLPYCTFDMNRSGAGLAWDHFHPGQPRPWMVDYVEDRDLWRFRLPHSHEVSLRVRLTPHSLAEYDLLSCLPLESVHAEAAGAKLYLDHYCRDALRNAYLLSDVDGQGTDAICVNVSYTGVSDVLHAVLTRWSEPTELRRAGPPMALAWHLNLRSDGVALACSLRSLTGFDCSPFAKSLGGGGHAQAAGFRLELEHPLAKRLMAGGAHLEVSSP